MKAIEIIKESRQTHKEWQAYFEKYPDAENWPEHKKLGGAEFNKKCVKDYTQAITEIERLQAELEALKKFARHVIRIECWSICDQDGGDIQELSEKLGLIELHIATKEDVDDESDFDVGDEIYKFSQALKGE